jgi:hypothetical protein
MGSYFTTEIGRIQIEEKHYQKRKAIMADEGNQPSKKQKNEETIEKEAMQGIQQQARTAQTYKRPRMRPSEHSIAKKQMLERKMTDDSSKETINQPIHSTMDRNIENKKESNDGVKKKVTWHDNVKPGDDQKQGKSLQQHPKPLFGQQHRTSNTHKQYWKDPNKFKDYKPKR